MSGIQCVWANISDSTLDWYENEFIGANVSSSELLEYALHCEVTSSGMEGEPVGKLDSPWRWLAVYDTSDLKNATDHLYRKSDLLSDNELQAKLAESRFDVRTYSEVKCWKTEDWSGDTGDIASVSAMEWSITAEMEDKVIDYYINTVGPFISSSPDILRFRLFKIDAALTWERNEHTVLDKNKAHKYFTLVELATDEWPWSVVVDLAEDARWKAYFESQTVVVSSIPTCRPWNLQADILRQKWQLSHYLVQRSYPEHDSATESDSGEESDEFYVK